MSEGQIRITFAEGIKKHNRKFGLYSVVNRESVKIFEQESNTMVIILQED